MSKKNFPEKRIEIREKHLRVSRTGGVSATKTFAKNGTGVTFNTKHGIRLHQRIAKGLRIGFQRGNFQLIGRFNKGPFNLNISKSGFSGSFKNKMGAYNFIKPNYSSFRFAGIQIRGKKASQLQLFYLVTVLVINLTIAFINLVVLALWVTFLAIKWLIDFSVGFAKEIQQKEINP